MLNKKWFLGLATMSALTLAACGNGDTADEGTTDEGRRNPMKKSVDENGEETAAPTVGGEGVLDVWTFTDEAQTMINDYYLEEYPDLDYEINMWMTLPY
ncbi:MAG: hypothetical protein U5K84_04165 [Alkalibacterium sp.]|nr:hypothetical protein [Alkalibacterium sp.]